MQPESSVVDSKDSTSLLGAATRDLKRLQVVFRIIARHGFGELFLRSAVGRMFFAQVPIEGQTQDAPAAMRFRRLLEELGPTYIKFGQIMSMRPDIMPASYIAALEGLQDQTPAVAFPAIRKVVESALKQPLEELFSEFSETPLATASIGQTHLARTKDGERVIVKVQRPGIEETMRGDLSLLFMLAKALEVSIEEMRLLVPSDIVLEFERALLRELDFTEELENLRQARPLIDPERQVVVPKPYPELSARTVLTMEFFEGKSLRKIVPHSEEAKHAVEEILQSACKQVLIDGFFHGDPHAGNILMNDAGTLCMIDFGLVGHLREDQRSDIISLILAVVARDSGTIARVFLRMGTPLKRVNIQEFKAEINRILNTYLNVGSFQEMNTRELADEFVNTAQHFQIKLSPEYSVLIKASMTIEGLVRNLYPEVDALSIVKPYFRRLMTERYSPKALLQDSLSQLVGMPDMLKQLPGQIDQILHDAESGNLQIRAVTPVLDLLPRTLHHLASRFALVAFSSVMTLVTALFIIFDRPDRSLTWLIVCGVILSVSSWSTLFFWHFIRIGQPYRVQTLLQFFRR